MKKTIAMVLWVLVIHNAIFCQPQKGIEPVISNTAQIREKGDQWAVLIVSANFDHHPFPQNLVHPPMEMERLKKTLINDYGFAKKRVLVLVNPTVAEFIEFMTNLKKKIDREDEILCYYTGHGKRDTIHPKKYFLQFKDSTDDAVTCLSGDDLIAMVNAIGAFKIFLCIDACLAGNVSERFATKGTNFASQELIERYEAQASAEMLTASDEITTVADKSPFFEHFMKALEANEYNSYAARDLHYDMRRSMMEAKNKLPLPALYILNSIYPDNGGSFVLKKTNGKQLPLSGSSNTYKQPVKIEQIPLYEPPVEPKKVRPNALTLKTGPTFLETETTRRNEEISVSATGLVTVGVFLGSVTPDGRTKGLAGFNIGKYNIVPSIPHGAVMYRVSDIGPWKMCGSNCKIKIDKPGSYNIEFRINDNNEGDNSGEFNLTFK